MYKIGKMPQAVDIGYVGETNFRKLEIDMKEWMRLMPEGVPSIVCIRPGETKADAYVAVTTFEDDVLTWVITAADIGTKEGEGEIQIWLEEEENSSVIKRGKSVKVKTRVNDSANDPNPDTPTSQEAFIEQVTGLKTAAVNAKTAAEDAKDDAVAAKGAAEDAAEDAEAYAKGTRDGSAVTSEDPAYHNNAKYYAEQAETSATSAGTSATNAGTAKEDAEAYAVGTRNGTPVTSGDPAYNNNAKYYAEQVDPTSIIDDTAGEGATGKTWSADKLDETTGELLNAIQGLDENAVKYVLARKFHVGENLLTNETPYTGTGWSGTLSSGFTHATGNTDPIVFEVSTVENQAYIIDYDFTGSVSGDEMYVSIGDTPKVDVYHGGVRPFVGVISDGGYLKIYCKSSYTGTITNLKIRPVLESGGTEVIFECAEITNGQNADEISGWHNVSIGRDALSKNVNGTRSVAIGDRALQKMVTGHRNMAIGPYAMPFVKEGDCNVSMGSDTLYNPANANSNGKAYDNVAIGKGTLRAGSTESSVVRSNIAIGKGAMSECDDNAEQNVAIGHRAGTKSGDKNVYIGQDAGYFFTGDENTIIGNYAGYTQFHNGQRNVFIGAQARVEISGASAQTPKSVNNCIIIGAYTKGVESSSIYIGRSIHSKVVIAGKTINFNEDGTVTWS